MIDTRLARISFILPLLLTALSCGAERADSPLDGSNQLVLVVAGTDSTSRAELATFVRAGKRWRREFSHPVVIGRNGLGWGIGLHSVGDIDPAEPVKREGDGKSPMGAFVLPNAFGYLLPDSVETRLPYTQSDGDLICVDDTGSGFYNMVVNLREKELDPDSLKSHEDMLRRDDLYKYVIVVGHNTNPSTGFSRQAGGGSCIFIHCWGGPQSHTDGCTAMAEEDMRRLLQWLDPLQKPVLVQLTRKSYERLRDKWGLPASLTSP